MDDSTIIDVPHRRRDHEGDDGDGDGDYDYDPANVSTETPHMGDIDLETTAAGCAAVLAEMGDRDEHGGGGGGGGDGDGRGDDDDEHGAGGDGGDGGNGRITRVTVENGMGGENDGEDEEEEEDDEEEDDDDDDDDDDGVVEWEDFMADYWRMVSTSPPSPLPKSAATATAAGEDTDMRPCGMDPELDDERGGPSSRIRDSDDERRPRGATGRDHRARSVLVDMDATIVDDDSSDGGCDFVVGVEDLDALSRAGRACSLAMADIVGIGGTTEGGGEGGGDARGLRRSLRIDLGRRVVVASAGRRRRPRRDGGGDGDGATFAAAAVGGGDAVFVGGDRRREGEFGRTAPAAAVASPASPVPPVDDGGASYDEGDEGEDGDDDDDRDDGTSDASSSAGGAGVGGRGAGGASSAASSSAASSSAAAPASASASSAPSGAGSSSADWKHKTSPLPLPEMVHATGPIMTRTSLRSLVMKRWNPSYWMQYGGHTLFVFRSRDHMDDWRYNPYHAKKQRDYLVKLQIDFMDMMAEGQQEGTLGHRILPVKKKSYGKNEDEMYQFKLERWTNLGCSVLAAFASQEECEVQILHDTIKGMLMRCPDNGLRSIDHMLK